MLFELADGIETEADALNFYVAVCAWGAGTYAQQVARKWRPDFPTDVIEYTLFQGPAAALPPSI